MGYFVVLNRKVKSQKKESRVKVYKSYRILLCFILNVGSYNELDTHNREIIFRVDFPS